MESYLATILIYSMRSGNYHNIATPITSHQCTVFHHHHAQQQRLGLLVILPQVHLWKPLSLL